jgi:hypothetical protein
MLAMTCVIQHFCAEGYVQQSIVVVKVLLLSLVSVKNGGQKLPIRLVSSGFRPHGEYYMQQATLHLDWSIMKRANCTSYQSC